MPCIQGCTAQKKCRTEPFFAVTWKLTLPCGGRKIESPAVLASPMVWKPGAPVSYSGTPTSPVSGLAWWAASSGAHIGQLMTWAAVRGSADFLISDSECGAPSGLLLTSLIVVPDFTVIVPGAKC